MTLEQAPHSPNFHITPVNEVVCDADCDAVGTRFEYRGWHGGTLNSRRAASPLVWLVGGGREVGGNWGRTEQNRTVTCMVLKAKANDRRKISSP
ncbi:hypothetical protein TNCV_2661821 [Trichonephila clavipes]|nr:hypothetical protein TNCV_2661821 [Trichonephila clavipes]